MSPNPTINSISGSATTVIKNIPSGLLRKIRHMLNFYITTSKSSGAKAKTVAGPRSSSPACLRPFATAATTRNVAPTIKKCLKSSKYFGYNKGLA